jgi:hypothetical protein
MWTELRHENNWCEALDVLSMLHRGEPTTMTVVDPQVGRRVAVLRLPFVGVTQDRRASSRGFAVIFRGDGGTHVTRFIKDPEQVLVDSAPDGSHLSVLIHTHEGLSTLIELGKSEGPGDDSNDLVGVRVPRG